MADTLKLDSIEIELGGGLHLMIWGGGVSTPDHYDLDQRSGDPLRFRAKTSAKGAGGKVPIEYNPEHPSKGALALVLYENTDYRWRVSGKNAVTLKEGEIDSTIRNPGGRSSLCKWNEEWCEGKAPEGFFRVTNYLGTAEISVGSAASGRIRFEIQSRKLDYHEEYGAMVEDVAEHCRHLLMEWESPTSFSLSRDSGKQSETLLERFLFLRHLMGDEKLDFHLEMIARRPHAALEHEEEWMPASLANPSEFAVNPFKNARGWMDDVPCGIFSVGGVSPSEILHRNREETHDTPPNRFILFALTSFRDLCDEIMEEFDGSRGNAWLEASRMRESLDAFLARPFFRDISPLDRLPLESQTLQKREGYRDILQAWLLLDLAAKLDWSGRDEAYDGKNRDAATLYEFWLYFILLDVLKSRLGMEPWKKSRDKGMFVTAGKNGGVTINLRKGLESVSRLVWKSVDGTEMGVHFFYNRMFVSAPDPKISGSYSQAFWPDYTLAFFPRKYMEFGKWEDAEEAALKDGKIAYLHFDAKYRLDQIPGKKGPFGNDDEVSMLSEREEAKGCDTYKRGDLYKMHTYNDAIRRTAGSYVLYPGEDESKESKEQFPRYQEVAPGVGAFRLRPGPEEQRARCEVTLAKFIGDVLNHHGNTFSRNYRINYWTEKTIQETPAIEDERPRDVIVDDRPIGDEDALLVGYRSHALANLGKREGFAYVHAIRSDGTPNEKVDPRLFKASLILPYTFREVGLPEWCGWVAKITTSRLISRNDLEEKLKGAGQLESDGSFYYLVEFSEDKALDLSQIKEAKIAIPVEEGVPVRKPWGDLRNTSNA